MKSVAGTLRIYTDIKCMYRYTFTLMEIDSHRPPIKPQTEPQNRPEDESPGFISRTSSFCPYHPYPFPILTSIAAICRRIGQRPWTMQIEFQWRAINDAWLKFAIRVLSLGRKQSQRQIAIKTEKAKTKKIPGSCTSQQKMITFN